MTKRTSNRRGLVASGVLVLALAQGCATSGRSHRDASAGAAERELDELILLLADRKIYDSLTVTSALTSDADVRGRLADALGRTGTAEAVAPLVALLADDDLEVRRRAAFGLGVLGDPVAIAPLRAVVTATDRELGRLAVEAVAKLGAPLESVVGEVATLPEGERWARLAPSLYRFEPMAVLRTAVKGFGVSDPVVRRQLIYALARDPVPEGLPILRTFQRDPDALVRAWVARAMGLVGDRADAAWLLEALADVDGVAIQAAGALKLLAATDPAGTGPAGTDPVAPEPVDEWTGDWVGPWLALSRRERPGPRAAALAAAEAWPASEAIDERLDDLVWSGSVRELELGLSALGRRAPGEGEGPFAEGFVRLLELAVAHEAESVRAAAARVAAELQRTETVESLAFDEAPGVRMAVHEMLLSGSPDESAAAAVWILRDPDDAVRAAALEWLAEQPRLPVEVLATALEGFTVDSPGELVVDLVRAVAARAAADPLERGLAIEFLESFGGSSRYVVRRTAFEALTELGRTPARPEPAVTHRTPNFYRAVADEQSRVRTVEFETVRGVFRVELDCPAAPITCTSFLQLVRQGFYDGLRFHRVVPNFVVQTGDPRGDGWGGPGFDLRAEVTRLGYARGALGMADSGLDTAGSQIFLTLAPQPHLDGRYTAFGRTVAGDAILDEIEQGDAILSVREVEP